MSPTVYGSAIITTQRFQGGVLRATELSVTTLAGDAPSKAGLDKPGVFQHPRLSPDGERLAVRRDDRTAIGIWVYDLRRDTLTPLGLDATAAHPVWTPDGK